MTLYENILYIPCPMMLHENILYIYHGHSSLFSDTVVPRLKQEEKYDPFSVGMIGFTTTFWKKEKYVILNIIFGFSKLGSDK